MNLLTRLKNLWNWSKIEPNPPTIMPFKGFDNMKLNVETHGVSIHEKRPMATIIKLNKADPIEEALKTDES